MKKICTYDQNGVDIGWQDIDNWWFDTKHKDAFEIFDIDSFYENNYFKHDHIPQHIIDKFIEYLKLYYQNITNKPLQTILEIGCGGGWFTKALSDQGFEVTAIEGSQCGYDACLRKGLSNVYRHDIRRPLNLYKQFDAVVCTEVGEHIEPPFSSQLIQNLVNHSDFIWFSFEEPYTNRPHYHHPNEQPAKFWINLFRFYGFDNIALSDQIRQECYARASHIFFKS